MPHATTQLCIDGHWITCQSADGYGTLGTRHLCDLGTSAGQPAKKLLIRRKTWPQVGDGAGEQFAKLTTCKVPDDKSLGLRRVMTNKYQQTVAQPDGSPRIDTCPVLQQDVTGLISLKQAILRVAKSSQPQQIWQLFHNACRALDNFGEAVGGDRPVPLQCPDSLAVDANNHVVPLDAEVLVAGTVSGNSEVYRLYRAWFGEEGSKGFADRDNASVMHAKALVLYFRRLLGAWQQQNAGSNQQLPAQVVAPLERMPPGASLGDIQHWIQESAEDWDIIIDDDDVAGTSTLSESETGAALAPQYRKRSLLFLLSVCLNLLLIGSLVVCWLLWLGDTRAVAPSTHSEDDAEAAGNSKSGELFLSSYCVVFPSQGTLSEKVGVSLQELFPEQFREMKRHTPDHDKLLQEKIVEASKSILEPEKLKKLLIQLAADHSVRFKGFIASEPDEGLISVIEHGGVFTIANTERQQHGSLLQINGLEKILVQAGLTDQADARNLLKSLKRTIAEYASLKDALSIIGDRTAYLLRVEPTAIAHERVRRKLLSRLDKPVFISRPIPEFFDAVDPTADTGGGVASYSLRLDRKCFWRLASRDDRNNVDYANNASNDRMKWRSFEASQLITWRPIPLTRRNGRTAPIASFDIAVVLGNKVVVFRNQSLLVGDSRNQVLTQGRNYIEKALKLRIGTIEDAINVRQQEGQFTGTLIYSYLAEQVSSEDSKSSDLQILDLKEFDGLKMKEDDF